MKKVLKRISSICVCILLLVSSFLSIVSLAATGVYELTFDNLFVFEQWANNANSAVVHPGTPGELSTDIEAGVFNLVNTSTESIETYTAFGQTINNYYYIPVDANTQYTFAFSVERTESNATQNMESFVFFYDSNGNITEWVSYNPIHYGLSEWNFTTPEGTKYIQVRFDNNWPNSQAKVSDIRICESSVYEFSSAFTLRKVYTYSSGAVYGELPTPTREGLVFDGWYTQPDGNGEKITSDTQIAAKSYSLFSHWVSIPVSDLEIVSLPIEQNYCSGEKLNTRGLVLGVTYPDGSMENIDEDFVCSPTVLSEVGEQVITVSYGSGSTQFTVNVKESEDKTLNVNGSQKTVNCANNCYTLNYSTTAFNRFEISYSSDAYVKGTMNFGTVTEEFFLEASDNGSFSSYIDGFLDGTTQSNIVSITFEPLDKEFMDFTLSSLNLSQGENLSDDYGMVYLSSADYKIGIDLDWGGALTYLEDLSNDVVAAQKKAYFGTNTNPVEVGLSSDFKSSGITRYTTVGNVNLINAHDTGRLVQQSYYGAGDSTYEPGMFEGAAWPYNPVQGGNVYNDPSKIVDLKVTDNVIYIKCRPLDWAREAKYITPTYMEAWYTLEDGMMRASCRFVDFSGYPSLTTNQEVPAFYCVEPLNKFVYYSGGEAWSDSNTPVTRSDLQFWSGRDDQNFPCNENWAAFVGEGSSGYGIGVYSPGQTDFCAGVMERDTLTSLNDENMTSDLIPGQPAANHNSTSYIGVIDSICFQSYTPIAYRYYITTGDVTTIRNKFKPLAQQEEDICNATYTNGFCDMCGRYKSAELTTDKYDIDNDNSFDNVYEISNAGELYWFRDNVNNGDVTANAVLTCDITDNSGVLTGYGILASDTSGFRKWTAIGNATNKYKGHFDGQGHTVYGLYMNDTTVSYGGLFGYADSTAVIERVGIDYSYFYGNQYVGSICGYSNGKIENCYSLYDITKGSSYVGGITGYNNSTVINCYSAGIVQGNTYTGGIAGSKSANASFSNCYYLFSSPSDGSGTIQNGIGAASKGSVSADVSGATEVKTVEQFASGEIAYRLQSANKEQLWGQLNNASGVAPVFDTTGKYKVHPVTGMGTYSLVDIGDIDEDEEVDVQDYQSLVNRTLSGEEFEFKDMHISDINGDGVLDVLDCSRMELLINGNLAKIDVYLKGDYDCDGVPFTTEDIKAIKKGIINLDKIDTKQKYACDLNFDGVIDINDRDIVVLAEKSK